MASKFRPLVILLVLGVLAPASALPPDARVFFQPFADARGVVLAELSRAQRKVHIAQYNIRDEAYVTKLIELKNRGVEIQIVIDAKNAANAWNTLDDEMVRRGLSVVRKTVAGRYGIMHHKFTIVDDETILTGSFNWNETAQYSNNENMLVIRGNRALAADYEAEFQELLGTRAELRGSVSGLTASSPVRVLFSPEDQPRNELIRLMDQARTSIHIAVFSFKDSTIRAALIRALGRGVKVEVLTEQKQAATTTEDERIATAGAKVVVGENTSSTYAAMHHKYAVFDGTTVAAGACNWTYTAFTESHEDLLIVRDAAVARAYLDDFADLMMRYDASFEDIDYLPRASGIGAVNFIADCDKTTWGEDVRVVGDHPALGSWDPTRAVLLATTKEIFPRWNGFVEFPAGTRLEYKYIRVHPASGQVIWESGANRVLVVNTAGRKETRIEPFRD